MGKLLATEETTLLSVVQCLSEQIYLSSNFTKDKTSFINCAQKFLKDIFIGHASNAESGWTGDLLVTEAEEMKDNIASEVYVERFKEKVVGSHKEGEHFILPHADGSTKVPENDSSYRH